VVTQPADAVAEDPRDMQARAWAAAASVLDPEVPCVTVADLGILRSVEVSGSEAIAKVTPTYSGCPAVQVIEQGIAAALESAGFVARIERVMSPAWTTDWISEIGRAKLRAYGIAPPTGNSQHSSQPHTSTRISFFGQQSPECPRCGSDNSQLVSEFGSTACKALYRCLSCAEPFDYFKPL